MDEQAPQENVQAEGGEQAEAEQRAEAQSYKLKVNGKEVSRSLDELIRDAQKGMAADEKFQQAASMAKKYAAYEQLEKAIEQGNIGTLVEKLGHDKFRSFAENYLIDYLEYEQLSPEKKEAIEYRRRADDLQRQLEAEQQEKVQRQQEAARSQAMAEIDQEISDVLKQAGKKPTPYLVARIAEQMLASLESREDADPKSVAKSAYDRAVKSLRSDVTEYLSELSIDEARKVLPKELLDALRRSDIEAVKAQDPMRSRQTAKSDTKQTKPGQKVRMSTDEFFKQRIEKMIGA